MSQQNMTQQSEQPRNPYSKFVGAMLALPPLALILAALWVMLATMITPIAGEYGAAALHMRETLVNAGLILIFGVAGVAGVVIATRELRRDDDDEYEY